MIVDCRALLARKDIVVDHKDRTGMTPKGQAVFDNRPDIVKILEEHGALRMCIYEDIYYMFTMVCRDSINQRHLKLLDI